MTATPRQTNSEQTGGAVLVCVLPEPVAGPSGEAVECPSPARCFQAGPCSVQHTLTRRVVLLSIGTRVKIYSLQRTDTLRRTR